MSPTPGKAPAQTLSAVEDVGAWLSARRLSRVAVVVDAGVADAPAAAALVSSLRAAGCAAEVHRVSGPGSLSDALELERAVGTVDAVVAVGGGAALDRAKAAVVAGPLAAAVAASASDDHRPGAVVVRPGGATVPIVAVPTTLGTGSERSANTVVDLPDGRILASSPAVAPAVAVLDPRATSGLGAPMVLAGAFEALCRTVGPYVGARADTAHADQLALAVATRLVTVGDLVAADPSRAAGVDVRSEVSRLSGLSHAGSMHQGRSPFAYGAWYVSHELSWLTGLRKVDTLAGVLPALWADLLDGEVAWGDAARARAVASVLARPARQTGPDPAAGMSRLARDWGLWPGRFEVSPAALAERVRSRWAVAAPHLAHVPSQALERLAERVSDRARDRMAAPAPVGG